MNKIPGYNESPAYTGESQALPAGKYICEIKGAKVVKNTSSGTEQLVLQLDIAEGDYKNYYSDAYAADLVKNGSKAKWRNGGLFRQGWEGKSLPYFHGLMTCIEKSNNGFYWGKDPKGSGAENWDEKTLKGKKIGVLFGREQFRASDGSVKFATKAVAVRSIEGLEKSEIPKDKLLNGSSASQGFDTSGFSDLDDTDEDDLPF